MRFDAEYDVSMIAINGTIQLSCASNAVAHRGPQRTTPTTTNTSTATVRTVGDERGRWRLEPAEVGKERPRETWEESVQPVGNGDVPVRQQV